MKTQTIDPSLTRRVWRKLLSGSGDRPRVDWLDLARHYIDKIKEGVTV